MNFADYGKSKLLVITSELDRRFPSSITVPFNYVTAVTANIFSIPIIETALHRNSARGRKNNRENNKGIWFLKKFIWPIISQSENQRRRRRSGARHEAAGSSCGITNDRRSRRRRRRRRAETAGTSSRKVRAFQEQPEGDCEGGSRSRRVTNQWRMVG